MNSFNHMGGWGCFPIVPLVLIAIIIYIFRQKTPKEPTAQEILDKRYAIGGISYEEYIEKSKHLALSKSD